MIRNVVLGRLAADASDADRATLDRGLAGVAALTLPGMLANHVGRDAGLRAGGWDFAITNDWVDAQAYAGYDAHEEHNVHREAIRGVSADLARVQFAVPA